MCFVRVGRKKVMQHRTAVPSPSESLTASKLGLQLHSINLHTKRRRSKIITIYTYLMTFNRKRAISYTNWARSVNVLCKSIHLNNTMFGRFYPQPCDAYSNPCRINSLNNLNSLNHFEKCYHYCKYRIKKVYKSSKKIK